ncbi:MAG: hypothetical protein AYL29_014330 [Candidatus Bathyarchaeota archaeon B24]|nr:MAG: hypothetical protein AYL29_014330 [Candidatus Bathyarchaeota archaeon B24]
MVGERILERDELESMLIGVGILGTGGGGDPEFFGKPLIEWDLERGREYRIVDPVNVRDNSLVVSGGYAGSVKAYRSIGDALKRWETKFELLEAFKVMESLLGREVDHVVPFELGGANTPVILSLASRVGITAIDGDGLGRAAPETHMSSFLGHGISITPMPFVDRYGNVLIVKEASDPTYPDEIMRLALQLGGGVGANNHYPMSGRELKESVIPNTISLSIRVGDSVREAVESKRDPIEAVLEVLGGFEIFRGVVKEIRVEDVKAHYHARSVIRGEGQYSGRNLEIIFKNEAMAAFIDGEAVVIFPDLICLLNPENGRGIMTTDIRCGMKVAVLGVPAHKRLRECLRTDLGKEAFDPKRFGLPGITYEPVEDLIERVG